VTPNATLGKLIQDVELGMWAFRRRRPASWGEQGEVGCVISSTRTRRLYRGVSAKCSRDAQDIYLEVPQDRATVVRGPGSRTVGSAILKILSPQSVVLTCSESGSTAPEPAQRLLECAHGENQRHEDHLKTGSR
jgi:hypothetical protein